MFDPNLALETERLCLKPPVASDFEAFCEMMADEPTARFIGGELNRAQSWRAWCTMIGAWHMNGFGMFSVYLKDSGDWIGRIGPWLPEGWPGKEVGWGLHPKYAGKGYAFEAACAAVDYAFEILGWEHVIHTIDPENLPSIALAKRLGAENEGRTRLPEPYHESVVDSWGQSREQWQAKRK